GIELKGLNLLIGPNGSGKSNLIEAISFMRAAPREFEDVTHKGGGVTEWNLERPASKIDVDGVDNEEQRQNGNEPPVR
ncbi:MAG: ATP-binding protein, partial [Verrucomicrobiaceae bacterium]